MMKKMNNKDKNKLTDEEKEMLESYEAGDWEPVDNVDEEITKFQQYAEATVKKDKRINIRISSKNLDAIQKKALEEGIPYQTLISSILHKYVNGRLIEKS
jgi:predicted DNA binding CopG/RHH family protein